MLQTQTFNGNLYRHSPQQTELTRLPSSPVLSPHKLQQIHKQEVKGRKINLATRQPSQIRQQKNACKLYKYSKHLTFHCFIEYCEKVPSSRRWPHTFVLASSSHIRTKLRSGSFVQGVTVAWKTSQSFLPHMLLSLGPRTLTLSNINPLKDLQRDKSRQDFYSRKRGRGERETPTVEHSGRGEAAL